MENNHNDYHVSFFKPVNEKARQNRNMVIWLVLIWAIAVFGFQFLLRAVEEPVPEPAYESFTSVWQNIESGSYDQAELKTFANAVLTVLGKVYVKPAYKASLNNAFSWSVNQLGEPGLSTVPTLTEEFKTASTEGTGITDPSYLEAKNQLETEVANMLEVSETDPRRLVIPFSLAAATATDFPASDQQITEEAMSLYLIHNRSFLTDATFLGFPFHYFYTAVFLLTLFIGLCWAYCFITDKREAKQQQLIVQ